jgi:hypothetical protein
MALTLVQAIQRLSHPVMQGIIKTIVTTDQMAAMLPIVPVAGDAMRVVREGDLPVGGAFIPDTGVTTENSTGKHDRTMVEFRRLVGNMDVDYLANVMSGGTELPMQVEKKVKATWRKVQNTIINGNRTTSHTITPSAGSPGAAIGASATYSPWLDSERRGPGGLKYTHVGTLWQFRAPGDPEYGDAVAAAGNGTYTLYSYNKSKWIRVTITAASATADGEVHIRFNTTTNEFEGVEQLCDPGMVIDPVGAAGDDYGFSILDRLISMVKIREGLAFCMPGTLLEKHYAACRALGGTTPEFTEIPGIMGKSKVPAYRGIPLLVNDFIPSDEVVGATSNASSLYLAALDANEGLFLGGMTYGGMQVSAEADPRNVPVLGFYLTDVGPLEGADHRRTRIGWCGAMGLKSPLALARKRGIKTA